MTQAITDTTTGSLLEHPLVLGTMRDGKRLRQKIRINLGDLTPNNIGTLRKLNAVLFPVAYSPKFYADILDPLIIPPQYSKLIFYQDLCVGNIVCRLEDADSPSATTLTTSVNPPPLPSTSTSTPSSANISAKPKKLYIMTLGVLAPYRSQGLGTTLLSHVLDLAAASNLPPPPPPAPKPAEKKTKTSKDAPAAKAEELPPPPPLITSISLHVQTSNTEGRKFYEKHGFQVTETVEGYFRKVEPRSAWRMEKEVVHA